MILLIYSTKNILFICGGAFTDLSNEHQSNLIGFHTSKETAGTKPFIVSHETIMRYGLMPELVGRLPVLVHLEPLQENDLVRILTEPEDSITKEYQMLFKKDGIDLVFEDEALHEIAGLATASKTGARGLRSILEDVLLDIMFDIPNIENIATCVITKDTITTKVPVLTKAGSASDSTSEQCVF